MVLEPSLAVFYREIIWVGGTKILPDGHRFKVVTKGMQVIFHRSPTPIKHSVCCYVSQSPEGICRKTIMHHQPTYMLKLLRNWQTPNPPPSGGHDRRIEREIKTFVVLTN
jgi:hypothetical protein